jgi:hypothetical protein
MHGHGDNLGFNSTNFKVSLIIKIINKFYGILKLAHLIMLVIFHVSLIPCENYNLPHICCIFVEKTHFLRQSFSNKLYDIQHGSNHVK